MVQTNYLEQLPPPWLSNHIEVFWFQKLCKKATFVPQGVFDLLLHQQPLTFTSSNTSKSAIPAGLSLLGQQLHAYHIESILPQWLFGIRLKPFSFFQQKNISALEIKNSLVGCEHVFSNSKEIDNAQYQLAQLNSTNDPLFMNQLIDSVLPWLKTQFLNNEFNFPVIQRAQTNLILNARGDIQVSEICSAFDISKVTLRKHFLSSLGILPKELSKIWRVNNFILYANSQSTRLTDAALHAGFYDQAHLNREFKSIFNLSPKSYFQENQYCSHSTQHMTIHNRFIGSYDPV